MTGYDTISLLSDFGHADEFVGVMHSVIRSIAPDVAIVDITHGIAPFDIRAGGLALARSANYLNPGVVVAVVDPGVGTARRPIAVEVGGGISVLVGPDNGLLAPAVGMVGGATRAVEISNPEVRLETLGATFDGRDVFAPAAAHLANGVALDLLGPEIDTASLMPAVVPVSELTDEGLTAEVLWIDRFGNCQLNIGPDDLVGFEAVTALRIKDEDRVAMRAEAYDAIESGRIGVVIDSSGLVSLAMARTSAAAELGLREGDEVQFRELDEGPRPSVVTPVVLGRSGETS